MEENIWDHGASRLLALVVLSSVVAPSTGTTEMHATVGLSVTLNCNIGEATTVAMWFSPSKELLTNDYARQTWDTRFQVQKRYPRERNLIISSVRLSDEGVYTCKQAGTTTIFSDVMLRINVPPIVEPSENVAAQIGDDVTISCRLTSGKPAPSIRWYFQGNGDEYALPQVRENLTLKAVTRDLAGDYSCKANNGIPPEAKKTIRVDVLFAPVSSLPNRELRQAPATNAILMCIVDANPMGDVYWERDHDGLRPVTLAPSVQPASAAGSPADQQPASISSAVKSKFRFQTWPLSRDGYTRLVGAFIDNLDALDFGTYTCYSHNKYGSTAAKIAIYAVNDSEISLPSTSASLGRASSTDSIVVLLATLLVVVTVAAAGLGVMVVRLRRGVVGKAFDVAGKQPQLYRHCRTS